MVEAVLRYDPAAGVRGNRFVFRNDVQLHGFAFDPARLSGLLTFAERQFFAGQAQPGQGAPRIVPAEHAAARVFATLLGGIGGRQALARGHGGRGDHGGSDAAGHL